MDDAAKPLLEARNLNVRYGAVEAVPSAALRVMPNQIAALIGPNGAGKSTLLNALMGALVKPGSSRGDVFFDGENIAALPVADRCKRGLILVPETRELFGSMPVEDNLVLGAYLHRADKPQLHADLDRVYSLFPRLKERRTQAARTLSGGERQMLALGRALMGRPRLLMLDEPSLGLAPRIVGEVFDVIVSLPAQGISVLLVEQNARAALKVAHHAYVLETGQVTLEGRAAALRTDPRVIETYLGISGAAK